jgi:hypothetical protein
LATDGCIRPLDGQNAKIVLKVEGILEDTRKVECNTTVYEYRGRCRFSLLSPEKKIEK